MLRPADEIKRNWEILYNFRGTNQNMFVLAPNNNMIYVISMTRFEKKSHSRF